MSNCQKKTVKSSAGWIAFITYIIVVAAVLGTIFGIKGIGTFNTSAVLDDVNTLTISMNQTVYSNELDKVEDACEDVFKDLKVAYQLKGEMSGDESEIVYVFDKDVSLSSIEKKLDAKFAEMTSDEGELKGSFIYVASNSEESVDYLAKNYALRGFIAGIVLVAAVYVYAAIRFGIGKGVAVALGTFYGLGLTISFIMLTRIPVTVSVSYIFAMSALLSAIVSVVTMNKIAASEKSEDGSVCPCATKEIMPICLLTCAALIVLAIVGTKGVAGFALTALVGVIMSTLVGLKGVPMLYHPIKVAAEKKPDKDSYIGAEKTSTKVKKVFAKKEEVKAVPVKEVAAAPVEEPVEEAVEETAEEVAEEVTEEPVEEAVEETAEEVAEEATEEPVEEAVEETVEEVAEVAEEAVEETTEEQE